MKHEEMVAKLCKPGRDIAEDLNSNMTDYRTLMNVAHNCVEAGQQLDKAKKQAIYNKAIGLRVSNGPIPTTITPLRADFLHMAVGIVGEATELLESVLTVIEGGGLDLPHLIEECGDLEFYLEGLRQAIHVSREEILKSNINKLSKRYEGFNYSDKAAQKRADKISPQS